VSEATLEYLEHIVNKFNLGMIKNERNEKSNIQECINPTDSVYFMLQKAREDLGLKSSKTSSSAWGASGPPRCGP